MGQQYQLLKALQGSQVPVPPVLGMEPDAAVLGAPFYVMEKVEGWVPSDFPPYHVAGPLFEAGEPERERIWWNAVDTLASIHTLDWQKAGLSFLGVPGAGTDFMQRQIAWYDEVFAQNGEALPPILAHTRQWLLENAPVPKHIALCWGDARLGNLLMRGHQVAAVLGNGVPRRSRIRPGLVCAPASDLLAARARVVRGARLALTPLPT